MCHIHLGNPVSGIGRSVSVADCSEVAVFRTGQGLAANVLSLKNGGWKTRFLIAFSVLRIYYATFVGSCQLKSRKVALCGVCGARRGGKEEGTPPVSLPL